MPHCDDTDLHKSVLVECIWDTGYLPLPFHRVCLKSKYVTGDETVGVLDKIPVEGVHMLLGNDLVWRLARRRSRGFVARLRARTRSSISGTLSARDVMGSRPTGSLTARVLGNGGSARPRVSNRDYFPGRWWVLRLGGGRPSFLSPSLSLLSPRQSSLGTARLVSLRLVSAEPHALSATRPLGHSPVFSHVRSKACLYR